MAVGVQGRQQARSDLRCRDGRAGEDAAAAPLHPLKRDEIQLDRHRALGF